VLPGTTYEYTLFSDSASSSNSTGGSSTSMLESEGAGARAVVSWCARPSLVALPR